MAQHAPLPVLGELPQSDESIALVNRFRQAEERLFREIDALRDANAKLSPQPYDGRLLAMAQTNFELGFLLLTKAVFRPTRIALPGDPAYQQAG